MKISKYKALFSMFYIVALLVLVFAVHSIISADTVEVSIKSEPKPVVEISPVNVTLAVEVSNIKKSYSVNMQTSDTVMNMLEKLRQTQGFTYEKSSYVYGDKVDNINGLKAPVNMDWHVYNADSDITLLIGESHLKDKDTYTLKLGPVIVK